MIKIADTNIDNIFIEIESSSQNASSGIDRLVETLSNLNNNLSNVNNNTNKFVENMGKINSNINKPKIEDKGTEEYLGRLQTVGNILAKTFDRVAASISKTIGTIIKTRLIKAGIDGISKAFTNLGRKIDNIKSKISNVIKNIKRYTGALFGIRSAFYGIRNTVNEFLSSQDAVAKQLNVNISYLKFAIGSMFAPVIEYITNLIYKLLQAIQYIVYYFSKINIFAGKTAKSYAAMGKSAGTASKELQKQLQAFDELNNITLERNNGSGGGTGTDTPTFDLSEVNEDLKPLFEDLELSARNLAKKINKSLASIKWDKALKKAQEFAKKAAKTIDAFIDELDFGLIGYTLAQGLNTALTFIDIYYQERDWRMLGRKWAEGFNIAIETIQWETLGRVLTDKFRALILKVATFVQNANWKELGEGIGKMLMSAFNNIPWEEVGILFSEGIKGILDVLINIEKMINTEEIKNSFKKAFEQIDWKGIFSKLTELISNSGWLSTLGFMLIFSGGSWKLKLAAITMLFGITAFTTEDSVSTADKINAISKIITGAGIAGAVLAFKTGHPVLGLAAITLSLAFSKISATAEAIKKGDVDTALKKVSQIMAMLLGGVTAGLIAFSLTGNPILAITVGLLIALTLSGIDMSLGPNSLSKYQQSKTQLEMQLKQDAALIGENTGVALGESIKNNGVVSLDKASDDLIVKTRKNFNKMSKESSKSAEESANNIVDSFANGLKSNENLNKTEEAVTTQTTTIQGKATENLKLSNSTSGVSQEWANSVTNGLTNLSSNENLKKVETSSNSLFNKIKESGNSTLENNSGYSLMAKNLADKVALGTQNGLSSNSNLNRVSESSKNLFGKITNSGNSVLGIRGNTSTEAERIANNTTESLARGLNNNSNVNAASNNVASGIKNNLNEASSNSWDIGWNVVSGVARGINSGNNNRNSGSLWSAVSTIKNNITNWLKNGLGIHSPSIVMEGIAKFIPLGIAKGINDNSNSVYEAMNDIVKNVSETNFDDMSSVLEIDTSFVTPNNKLSATIDTNSRISLEDTMKQIAEYCYQAIKDGFDESEAPQVNVNIGNEKIYSGYTRYQSQASNQYGVTV